MGTSSRTGLRVAAALLGGLNAVLQIVAGASIPADDIIFGDLGALLRRRPRSVGIRIHAVGRTASRGSGIRIGVVFVGTGRAA